jgi:hypothetical protein
MSFGARFSNVLVRSIQVITGAFAYSNDRGSTRAVRIETLEVLIRWRKEEGLGLMSRRRDGVDIEATKTVGGATRKS